MICGLLAKFSQSSDLRDALLQTRDAILCESVRHDHVWGTGLPPNHPDARRPDKWPGKNKLGKCLMFVRDYLQQTDEDYRVRHWKLPEPVETRHDDSIPEGALRNLFVSSLHVPIDASLCVVRDFLNCKSSSFLGSVGGHLQRFLTTDRKVPGSNPVGTLNNSSSHHQYYFSYKELRLNLVFKCYNESDKCNLFLPCRLPSATICHLS